MIRSDGAGGRDELRAPFVEQRTYRRRRLMDIARLAPLIGVLLFLVPLLWPEGDSSAAPEGGGTSSMSSAMIYIFSVWVGLVLFSVGFSVAVRHWAVHWTGANTLPEGGDLTDLTDLGNPTVRGGAAETPPMDRPEPERGG